MTFVPTFAMSFYRSAAIGNSSLLTTALLSQPLTMAQIQVLQPFTHAMTTMGAPILHFETHVLPRAKISAITDAHPDLSDRIQAFEDQPTLKDLWERMVVGVQYPEKKGELIERQIDYAWATAGASETDLKAAVSFVKILLRDRSRAVSLFNENAVKEISDSLKTTYRRGTKTRPAYIDRDELLWTLRRHKNDLQGTMRELGLIPRKFKKVFEAIEEDPEFEREYLHIACTSSGDDLFPQGISAASQITRETTPYDRAGNVLVQGALLMRQEGVLTRERRRLLIERARKFDISSVYVGENHFLVGR